ncbi:hypothetical protein AMATHDRAFT_137903 [Amanita thiersii Skay4041]|uniref:F-box domain-containing protein n=1 Tax=Amanita thiersii Skay4041 TaxID=703135 RepID=A0A2A9NT32_9AGAR|nr:hypothetical protein AMATHDRAFT_137903 [Amanita thiersii Skay4041]
MLDDLPSEIILTVISYLHLPDIAVLLQLSSAWNALISENESPIYRAAATLHNFIPFSLKSLDDLHTVHSSRALYCVSSWKTLCIRMTQINRSWGAHAPSTITHHDYTGDMVHRFKIDEKAAFILCTKSDVGGLTVTDFWNVPGCKVLWELPPSHVRPYAHCEYGEGYLIFDRFGGCKEVWRVADYEAYVHSSPHLQQDLHYSVVGASLPDERQLRASVDAARVWGNVPSTPSDRPITAYRDSPIRGHFIAWALLRPPAQTRAFRFVYPILLVASFNSAFLFDVRTGALVQIINNIQPDTMVIPPGQGIAPQSEPLGELNYVELGKERVYVCGQNMLRIFSREHGTRLIDVPAVTMNYGRWRWAISRRRDMEFEIDVKHANVRDSLEAWVLHGPSIQRLHVHPHVSPCDKHVAVLLETSRLLLIRNLDRIVRNEMTLFDSTMEIQLGWASRSSRYLAFENGKVGVASRNGIFIIIPPPSFLSSLSSLEPSVPPTVLRVDLLNDPIGLKFISCLQMTATGLFVNFPTSRTGMMRRVGSRPSPMEATEREMYGMNEEYFWSAVDKVPMLRREFKSIIIKS